MCCAVFAIFRRMVSSSLPLSDYDNCASDVAWQLHPQQLRGAKPRGACCAQYMEQQQGYSLFHRVCGAAPLLVFPTIMAKAAAYAEASHSSSPLSAINEERALIGGMENTGNGMRADRFTLGACSNRRGRVTQEECAHGCRGTAATGPTDDAGTQHADQ